MLLLATQVAQKGTLSDLVVQLVPWLIVIGAFAFFILPKLLRAQKANVDRFQNHMNAVEAKLDRLIEIAERRSKDD
jgi:hypothetical protein